MSELLTQLKDINAHIYVSYMEISDICQELISQL